VQPIFIKCIGHIVQKYYKIDWVIDKNKDDIFYLWALKMQHEKG